jgi:hypothetical protein
MKIPAPDVWRWAYSDFLPNAQRGVLAEYIVALAVGAESNARKMWDAVDVVSPRGVRIEVKSAAYLQAWEQAEPSKIRFDIAPRRIWDKDTKRYACSPSRAADVYVFALFETTGQALADPLDLAQWSFRSCDSAVLDGAFGSQRTVSLAALERLGLRRLSYEQLIGDLRERAG